MLLSWLDNQKGIRKLLVDLLYKKGYCLCIPDPKLIKSYFEQVRPGWTQEFLLSKNTLGLSVIPMFMLIFVKNKRLTTDQSKRLLELLHVLMSRLEKEIFSNGDRRQLMQDFFACLFEFCRLQPQEIAILKDLQERLEDRFPPSNKIIKFFKQVRTRCHFFNSANFRNSNHKEDEISLGERSDLLTPEYARLNANYLTVR